MNKIKQVKELPLDIQNGEIFELSPSDIGYFTHSFFKYPCKFIPNIPKWAIEKYTKQNDFVLDCFAGSGTTLVEAALLNRIPLGIDFDKFSILLCETKTQNLTKNEILFIKKELEAFYDKVDKSKLRFPDLKNISHWFSEKNILDLATLKYNIDQIKIESIKNFLLVCFASIIRKCSYADDSSPKPYVSTRFKKNPHSVHNSFTQIVLGNLEKLEPYVEINLPQSTIIANDARNIKNTIYKQKVPLVITSPPYINAFDYVRSLRLENTWLGFLKDENIIEHKKKQIGTEYISSKTYLKKPPTTGIKKVDEIVNKIYNLDKKRATVLLRFFEDMRNNFESVKKLLKKNGHYVVVIGNSQIRKTNVETSEILIEIAEQSGFTLENKFSYVIKNRYLRIPRDDRGGLIKFDNVLDFKN